MKQGWEIKKLGDIANIRSGKSIDASLISDDSSRYPCFGGNGIRGYVENYRYDGCYPIIGRVGALCGNVHLAKGKFNATEHALIVETKRNDINVEWLTYNLISLKLRDVAKGVAQPVIAASEISKIAISIPSIAEQEKIVAELDCLSGIIEKKKQQLKELDNLAQSIFYEMFGDPVENDKGWEMKRLGDVSDVTSFKRVLIEDVVEEGVPFIRGTELSALSKLPNSKNYEFTLFITPEHYNKVKPISGVPVIGDLLIPSINADGLIWVVDTNEPRYYKDGRVLWVHTNREYSNSTALRYIMSNKLRLLYKELASGATFIELKLFVLRDMVLPFPPLTLQQDFSSKIESIEKQKELIAQSIKETETLFNSRMGYYFN